MSDSSYNGQNNAVPISMAVLLHVALLASMLAAFDFARPTPITPMAINATLVTDIPEFTRPIVVPPDPEPVIEDPEPELEPEPEPDNSEELRRQAEEEKRAQDTLIEKDRLEKIRQEKIREEKLREEKLREQQEADRKRKEREEAEREKREEEEKARKRVEAERKREEDAKRQREENERLRKEMENEQRVEEIEDEERRFAVNNSPAMAAYQFAIAQRIRRNWSVPASAGADTECIVNVRQLAGGEIVGLNIVRCNGDEAVKRSVEAAIRRSSPLPEPSDPDLFRPLLELNLRPEQQSD